MPITEQRIDDFNQRIANNLKQLQLTSAVDPSISRLISAADLVSIYAFLQQSHVQNIIKTTFLLNHGEGMQASIRLDKNNFNLPRTVNILVDIDGEIKLMLETKRKLIEKDPITGKPRKDPNALVVGGTFKTGKVTWRIDSEQPEKWMNMRAQNESLYDLLATTTDETQLSQQLAQAAENTPDQPINKNLLGSSFYKQTRSIPASKGQPLNIWRQSYYSPFAETDLYYLLESKKLTEQSKKRIIRCILDAVRIMHEKGIAHQDIKPANILVFYDKQKDEYFARVADFGISTNVHAPTTGALASLHYDSPQIAYANLPSDARLHQYYFASSNIKLPDGTERTAIYPKSLGGQIAVYHQNSVPYDHAVAAEFNVPDLSNDMWALGIMLYQIYKNTNEYPQYAQIKNCPPLIRGLLEPERAQRLTIEEAIQLFENPRLTLAEILEARPAVATGQPTSAADGLPTQQNNLNALSYMPAPEVASPNVQRASNLNVMSYVNYPPPPTEASENAKTNLNVNADMNSDQIMQAKVMASSPQESPLAKNSQPFFERECTKFLDTMGLISADQKKFCRNILQISYGEEDPSAGEKKNMAQFLRGMRTLTVSADPIIKKAAMDFIQQHNTAQSLLNPQKWQRGNMPKDNQEVTSKPPPRNKI